MANTAEFTLTIVFRGLMVFHKTDVPQSRFEVGLLLPSGHHGNQTHIPRINTFKNGVLHSVTRIERRYLERHIWRLEVDEPLGGVSTDQQGEFIRSRVTHPRDYRWLIDLESREFHKDHANTIMTGRLKPVLHIMTGRFYTRLQSLEMYRQQGGAAETDFGMVSAAVGCDIRLTGSNANLFANTDIIFRFNVDPTGNTLYEIANTPPDTDVQGEDHFQHYYELFEPPLSENLRFQFRPKPASLEVTGPSPALCGGVRLGTRTDFTLSAPGS